MAYIFCVESLPERNVFISRIHVDNSGVPIDFRGSSPPVQCSVCNRACRAQQPEQSGVQNICSRYSSSCYRSYWKLSPMVYAYKDGRSDLMKLPTLPWQVVLFPWTARGSLRCRLLAGSAPLAGLLHWLWSPLQGLVQEHKGKSNPCRNHQNTPFIYELPLSAIPAMTKLRAPCISNKINQSKFATMNDWKRAFLSETLVLRVLTS